MTAKTSRRAPPFGESVSITVKTWPDWGSNAVAEGVEDGCSMGRVAATEERHVKLFIVEGRVNWGWWR